MNNNRVGLWPPHKCISLGKYRETGRETAFGSPFLTHKTWGVLMGRHVFISSYSLDSVLKLISLHAAVVFASACFTCHLNAHLSLWYRNRQRSKPCLSHEGARTVLMTMHSMTEIFARPQRTRNLRKSLCKA